MLAIGLVVGATATAVLTEHRRRRHVPVRDPVLAVDGPGGALSQPVVPDMLELVGQAGSADASWVVRRSVDGAGWEVEAAWGVLSPEHDAPLCELTALWADGFARGDLIVRDAGEPFSARERAIVDRLPLSACVAVPLLADGTLWGAVGVGWHDAARSWDGPELDVLAAAAQVLADAFGKDRARRRVLDVLGGLEDGMLISWRDGRGGPRLTAEEPLGAGIPGITAVDLLDLSDAFCAGLAEDQRVDACARIADGRAGGEPFALTYDWTDPDGIVHRIHHREQPARDGRGMARDVALIEWRDGPTHAEDALRLELSQVRLELRSARSLRTRLDEAVRDIAALLLTGGWSTGVLADALGLLGEELDLRAVALLLTDGTGFRTEAAWWAEDADPSPDDATALLADGWVPQLQKGWAVTQSLAGIEDEPRRSVLERAGVGGLTVIPVFVRGPLSGMLLLGRGPEDRALRPVETEAAEKVVGLLTAALRRTDLEAPRGLLGRAIEQTDLEAYLFEAHDLRIREASPGACRSLGWLRAELIGRHLGELVVEPTLAAIAAGVVAADGGSARIETEHRRRDGSVYPVSLALHHVAGEPLIVGVAADISAQQRLETQLQAVQRVEALGRLASGVTHDLKNLVGGVRMTADSLSTRLARHHPEAAADVAEDLRALHAAADRAGDVVRALMDFAKRRPDSLDELDPCARVDGMLPLLRGLAAARSRASVTIETAGDDGLRVRMDATAFERAVINLANNAVDAMPDGGTLRIEARSVIAATDTPTAPRLRPGHWIVVSVTDTGTGIDPAIRDRLFEPYTTTKEVEGRGTGLGLAGVAGIVATAGGAIGVASEPGRGTTMSLWLPPADAAPVSAPTVSRGTLLLVEDHGATREVAARVLRDAGFEVIEAPDPEGALHAAATAPRLDLALCDVILPGITGPALALRLRELVPGLVVRFTSGAPASALGQHGLGPERSAELLEKPFSRERLVAFVEAALVAPAA